jgi:hypothetical protein
MVPYVHQNNGEGINFAPELGSTCWVCKSSDTGRDAFVLGWTTVHEKGSYRSGRERLNSGDLHLSTRDANFLYLRRGGIVQIGATPICQRVYIPIRNIIRDFAENYQLTTPGGDLSWEVDRIEDSGDGKSLTHLTISCKEHADDPNQAPLAVLKIGSHGGGSKTILSLVTRDSGGGSVKTNLTISKAGDINWTVEGDVTLAISGQLSATVKKSAKLTVATDLKVTAGSAANFGAPTISLVSGAGQLVLGSGGAALSGGAVQLGAAMAPVVIDNGQLSAWINQVTALLLGVGPAAKSPALLPPIIYKSKDVKA